MLDALPVTHVTGIGQRKATSLQYLGIMTVDQLLHDWPVRYEDWSVQTLGSKEHSGFITVKAVVEGQVSVRWQGQKSQLRVPLRVDQRYLVTGVWYNQPYFKTKLSDGRVIVLRGRYDPQFHTLTVSYTNFSPGLNFGGWVPIYRGTEGLTSQQMSQFITTALKQFGNQLPERLPRTLMQKYRLVSHIQAVTWMHQPANAESLRQAHRRLAFEEFLIFQLQLQGTRLEYKRVPNGLSRKVSDEAWFRFVAGLPASLTGSQVKVCNEIAADLKDAETMYRLLQGDVGSGKTWVALWACYAAVSSGYQAVIMAPTEILADQHFREATQRLGSLGVKVAELVGGMGERQRREVLDGLLSGEIDLLVSTHAVLTEDVIFARLGMVVADEQHRFGVVQRSVLRSKGDRTDVLLMSATPIPRSLALAIYGDMDISVLDEMPPGRLGVRTVEVPLQAEERAIRAVRRELSRGHQAYVVAPLVEDSENLSGVTSVTQLSTRLTQEFVGYPLEILHGRMTSKVKDEVMRRFVAGQIQVLVSTTVIEVGIHVPTATVMLVYHAERFGLAQLHQLRGRVGRGTA
ncbi:ATP-dependent DNA helicase RecG, partial [Alicyclobacillaceae bacterium I2511]